MTQAPIPQHEVHDLVRKLHARPEDLTDGDLTHRLERFTHYVVGKLRIADLDLHEWAIDEDAVAELSDMPPETRPPIVYDAVAGSMIDGIHRANAAARRGETEIDAWIGTETYLDPDHQEGFEP